MAEFSVSGLDELMLSMQEVAELPMDVKDEILTRQADVLVDEIKKRGMGYGVDDTGKMLKSIKAGKPRTKKDIRYVVVKPYGTRTRGKEKKQKITNSEVAFLVNYGTRHTQARPFFTDAVAVSEKTMDKIALEVVDRFYLLHDL